MMMPVCAFSQQVPILLDTFNSSPSGLTSRQLARWQILDNEYSDDTLYVIPPIDFSQIDSTGRFKISLPGGCQNMEYKTKRAEYYANGDLNFIAEAEERDTCECNCNLGDFTYVKKDSISIGMIIADGRAYEIRDLQQGKLCLRTVKGDEEIGCANEDDEEELGKGSEDDAIQLRDECCPVSILILHDAQANILGDIAARATMDLMSTHEALSNSNVTICSLRFNIVAIEEYTIPIPTGNAVLDLRTVRDDNQALRNQLSADIAVFYTAVDYQVDGRDIAGAALGLINSAFVADPVEDAYALIEATPVASARFTFSHEVAHLFQCRHENDAAGTFQHAHKFKIGCGGLFCTRPLIRTMVHNLPLGFDRILHYSNPDVKYRRKETGVTGTRNNALQLRNNGCTVADFRQTADDPLMISISGPPEVCLTSSVQFFAEEIGGDAPAPYTYIWETASSILGPYQTAGTSSSLTLYGSGVIGEIIYIRLTVTSNDNQVAEEFHILECVGPVGISCEQSLISNEGDIKVTAALPGLYWSVFPNPAQNNLEFNILLERPYTSLKIDLLDQNGRLLEGIGFREMETGKHSTRFDISNQPSGLYFVRITSPYGTTGTTIIKH